MGWFNKKEKEVLPKFYHYRRGQCKDIKNISIIFNGVVIYTNILYKLPFVSNHCDERVVFTFNIDFKDLNIGTMFLSNLGSGYFEVDIDGSDPIRCYSKFNSLKHSIGKEGEIIDIHFELMPRNCDFILNICHSDTEIMKQEQRDYFLNKYKIDKDDIDIIKDLFKC
jgi:hypothetical protein